MPVSTLSTVVNARLAGQYQSILISLESEHTERLDSSDLESRTCVSLQYLNLFLNRDRFHDSLRDQLEKLKHVVLVDGRRCAGLHAIQSAMPA